MLLYTGDMRQVYQPEQHKPEHVYKPLAIPALFREFHRVPSYVGGGPRHPVERGTAWVFRPRSDRLYSTTRASIQITSPANAANKPMSTTSRIHAPVLSSTRNGPNVGNLSTSHSMALSISSSTHCKNRWIMDWCCASVNSGLFRISSRRGPGS